MPNETIFFLLDTFVHVYFLSESGCQKIKWSYLQLLTLLAFSLSLSVWVGKSTVWDFMGNVVMSWHGDVSFPSQRIQCKSHTSLVNRSVPWVSSFTTSLSKTNLGFGLVCFFLPQVNPVKKEKTGSFYNSHILSTTINLVPSAGSIFILPNSLLFNPTEDNKLTRGMEREF